MSGYFPFTPGRDRPWAERYRDLRRRVERLESVFGDEERIARIMASGRYFKLAVTLARAYEQLEREFSWRRMTGEED